MGLIDFLQKRMKKGRKEQESEEPVPQKVLKWRAELEHIREMNRMLSEERKILTGGMEQELYDKQVELFYLGKSATKHIGFRGYLKIINKVSPRTEADFMTPNNYDPNKKPQTRTTAMVLRSAILNFSLFSLFEAWLLKRMHFVSIQKHQRRLHQKGWKGIVAFYSEEIPAIQEAFDKQEPSLRIRLEESQRENRELMEAYEQKIFQQEEEILRLRKQIEDFGIPDDTGHNKQQKASSESLEKAFPGTTRAHRAMNKARSPVQQLIRSMEKSNSSREVYDASPRSNSNRKVPSKMWRTDQNRTWGASQDSEDESLYVDEDEAATEQVIGIGGGDDNDKLLASEKISHANFASNRNSNHDNQDDNSVWSDKVNDSKGPEINVYTNTDSNMSAITMPQASRSDSVSTRESLDETVKTAKDDYSSTSSTNNNNNNNNSAASAPFPPPPTPPPNGNSQRSILSSPSVGSANASVNSQSSAQKQQQQQVRNKDAIRLERERLEKAKADRKRRSLMQKQERESFYQQERERLKHQEKRLHLKKEESTRIRQERRSGGSVSGMERDNMDNSDNNSLSVSGGIKEEEEEHENHAQNDNKNNDNDLEEDLQDEPLNDEPLDALREVDHEYDTSDDERVISADSVSKDADDAYSEASDELRERPVKPSSYASSSIGGDDYLIGSSDENLVVENGLTDDDDDDIDVENVQLNDMDLGGGSKSRLFSPEHHPSMDADALATVQSQEKVSDRRKMWQVDRAESDRDLSVDDDNDSIENELKRVEDFEAVINVSDEAEIAASNISNDFKLLRSSSGKDLAGDGARARSRSRSRGRMPASPGSLSRRKMKMMNLENLENDNANDDQSVDSDVRSKSSKPKTRGRRRNKTSGSVDGTPSLIQGGETPKSAGSSKRSKSLTKKSRRKLKEKLEIFENSDDVSTFSKQSYGSKVSIGKKKKKKKGESRRKLKGTEIETTNGEDGDLLVKKKKKKKKKKKPLESEDLSDDYISDEDKTVTSALTTNSYD